MPLAKFIIYLFILSLLASCEDAAKKDLPSWHPDIIENPDTIKVALRVNPASYYWQDDKASGFDYQLLQHFSNYTNTRIEVIPVATATKAIDLLKKQQVDMAAGALVTTQLYNQYFVVSDPYYQSKQYMIYRYPDIQPHRFEDISSSDIDISTNPYHIESLVKLSHEYQVSDLSLSPDATIKINGTDDYPWYIHTNTPSHKLIEMINLGLIRYTVADAFELSATEFLYPYVKIAFTASETAPIVWLFNHLPAATTSQNLVHLANDLFESMRENGELDRITKAHSEHLELLPYAAKLTFIESAYRKLSKHKRYFKMAANKYQFDWKLIAAMAYQESHWNAKAVSPTGVKGIMMLTKEIAQHYKVYDRLDAYQSIMGGSKYLKELLARVPSEIPAPDRVWMALAAYLAGYGHLQDALRLTRSRGANPNSWIDLSHSMKLLQKPKWYQKAKHGKPRDNVVTYINNIRNYQFLLSLIEDAISTEITQPHQTDFILPENYIGN